MRSCLCIRPGCNPAPVQSGSIPVRVRSRSVKNAMVLMPQSVLNGIFKGYLIPLKVKSIKTPTFKALSRKIEQEREHFEEMSPHEKGRFDQYLCLLEERAIEERGTAEYDLYMFGVIVGMEIMVRKQGILNEEDNGT